MQGVAVATATDDNAADEKSDKSIWQLLNIRCTSSLRNLQFHPRCYLRQVRSGLQSQEPYPEL